MSRLVIVSNRVSPPSESAAQAGGLVVALREMLYRDGGVWFGWSGRVADDAAPAPAITTDRRVTYALMDLTHRDHDQYYLGYANSALWPVLHYKIGLLQFTPEQYAGYRRVNQSFARALLPLLRDDDTIWVHDYHLFPLGEELRRLGVRARIGFFLHTPFPVPEVLIALPRHTGIACALSAYDLVGFQTEDDVRALFSYVENEGGGRLGPDGAFTLAGRTARAAAFPIGIDTDHFAGMAQKFIGSREAKRLERLLNGRAQIIGVDRLDISKGLIWRLRAFEQLLATQTELHGRVTFMQIAPLSRTDVDAYQRLRQELDGMVGQINGAYADFDWVPIRYINKNFSRQILSGFYRMSRTALVTPERDGMNLVAKEFVAAQDPTDPGIPLISRFAGAARELSAALLVNPYAVDEVAETLQRALEMSLGERRERHADMMRVLRQNTIVTWRERFMAALRATDRVPALNGTLH